MRIGILSSMMALLAGAGAALGQAPETPSGLKPAAATDSTAMAPAVPGSLPQTLAPAPAPGCVAPAVQGPCDPGVNYGQTPGLPEFGPGFGPCPMGNCLYGSAEYLLWKIKDAPLPPNQLTVPYSVSGLTQFQSNFTFAEGVGVEYGGRSGGRFTLGGWVHPDQLLGLEATYFQFERSNNNFGGTQVVDLPVNFSVMNLNIATAMTIAMQNFTLPAQLRVSALGSTGPSDFWGTEINARSTRCFIGGMSIDLIGGFRYLNFTENFTLLESIRLDAFNSVNLSGPLPIPPNPPIQVPQPVTGQRNLAEIRTFDNITTRNQFYGAQVGLTSEWWLAPRFVVSGWGKVATGAMVETIRIVGNTTTVGSAGIAPPPGGGGLLTPGTGFVDSSRTRYAVIPEFSFSIGYQITSHIRANIGYDFLYVSTIARPGDQIGFSATNTTIAINGQPTTVQANQPTFSYTDTDLWAQGLTAGFSIRY